MAVSTYHPTDDYDRALDKLEAIARNYDPADPNDLRTTIIEVLGDLGIWPMAIYQEGDDQKARSVLIEIV